MQEYKPRFKLARRLLLPYSGEEVLTRPQAWRLILTWFVVFASALSLSSMPVVAMRTSSVVLLIIVFLLTFFCGGAIFALLATFVVYSLNRTALYQQKWRNQTVGVNPTATATEQH
jgi:predicted membrane protein